jgi:hypothetical protein
MSLNPLRKLIRRFPWIRYLVLAGLYTGFTLVVLNNLVLHLNTAIPGPSRKTDYAIFYWDLWWVKHAIFELHQNPVWTDYVLYPFTHNLAFHTLVPFWGIVNLVLEPLLGRIAAFNTMIVVSFPLTALCAFLFLRTLTGDELLAALGGFIFAFTPAMRFRASEVHLNMLPMWWLPLSLWLWNRLAARPTWGRGVALGFCIYLAWMTDLQFMMWIPLLLVPYALYSLFLSSSQVNRKKLLLTGLLAVAVVLLLGAIYPIPFLLHSRPTNLPAASIDTAQYFSLPLQAFYKQGSADRTVGRLLLALSLISLFLAGRDRWRWFWFLAAIPCFVLALGPYLGETGFSLPYLLLHKWSSGQYRTPARFAVPGVLALDTFVILTLSHISRRIHLSPIIRLTTVGVLVAGFTIDYRAIRPFPAFFVPDYPIYHEIGQETGDFVILEAPVGAHSGYGGVGIGYELQFYAGVHHKRIINGTLSRVPSHWLQFYRRSPLLSALALKEPLDPAKAGPELSTLVKEWPIGYVIIHRSYFEEDYFWELVEFFNEQSSICYEREEADLVVYRSSELDRPCLPLKPPEQEPRTWRLELGPGTDTPFVGSGWFRPEDIGGVIGRWAGDTVIATLRLDLPVQQYRVTFQAWGYPPNQTVTIQVNNQPVASIPLIENWANYTFTIPASVLEEGTPAFIQFQHGRLLSPHERTGGQSPDRRALAAAYDWIVLESVEDGDE